MTARPTIAHWIVVRPHQMPPQLTTVCIAYAFHGDDELTGDQGYWDGQDWHYTGGDRLPDNARVYYWAPAPEPPPLPKIVTRLSA